MTIITRRLPQSNAARKTVLNAAKTKLDNPGPIGVALTPPTIARLNALHASYLPAMTLVDQRTAQQLTATAAKNPVLQTLRLLCKHFIVVFNCGVERGKYPASHRPYYGIEGSNANLPDLTTQGDVTNLAASIINGDPLRVAAGGAAMANPDVTEVTTAYTALQTQLTNASNAKDALDLAQEAVTALNAEADKVIKKVWDEVETFFNEESQESKRSNARQWGVVYVTDGAQNTLTGLVKNAGGAPLEGATVTLVESGAETETNNEGRYALPTSTTGLVTVRAVVGALTGQVQVTIAEDAEGTTIEVGDIVVA